MDYTISKLELVKIWKYTDFKIKAETLEDLLKQLDSLDLTKDNSVEILNEEFRGKPINMKKTEYHYNGKLIKKT